MPLTMSAEREAQLRGLRHHLQATKDLLAELDAERAAHQQDRDRFTLHLRCVEATLGQIDQIPAIENEDDLIDLTEQSAGIAVNRIRTMEQKLKSQTKHLTDYMKAGMKAGFIFGASKAGPTVEHAPETALEIAWTNVTDLEQQLAGTQAKLLDANAATLTQHGIQRAVQKQLAATQEALSETQAKLDFAIADSKRDMETIDTMNAESLKLEKQLAETRAIAGELLEALPKLTQCGKCRGTGQVRVKHGNTYITDDADEIELAFHQEACPVCGGMKYVGLADLCVKAKGVLPALPPAESASTDASPNV